MADIRGPKFYVILDHQQLRAQYSPDVNQRLQIPETERILVSRLWHAVRPPCRMFGPCALLIAQTKPLLRLMFVRQFRLGGPRSSCFDRTRNCFVPKSGHRKTPVNVHFSCPSTYFLYNSCSFMDAEYDQRGTFANANSSVQGEDDSRALAPKVHARGHFPPMVNGSQALPPVVNGSRALAPR